MPAGGIANPHPGGFGTPLGRQKDRSAGSPLDWTSVRQAKHLLLPRPRKRGSGAESAGYGRIGECRGRAPEGERIPLDALPRPCTFGWRHLIVWRGQWTACAFRRFASLGFICEGANLLGCPQTSGADRVARRNFYFIIAGHTALRAGVLQTAMPR